MWLNAQRCYTCRQQRAPIRPSSSGPPLHNAEDTRQVLVTSFNTTLRFGVKGCGLTFLYFRQFTCVFEQFTNKIGTLVSLHYVRGSIF
jgi:hypothetical protein